MNWGTNIVLILGFFMLLAVGTGLYMVSRDHDGLIAEDYYEEGIAYDSTYLKKSNVDKFHAQPEINLAKGQLEIRFASEQNQGTLQLQRNSDASLDQNVPFAISGKDITLPLEGLASGQWKLQLNWKHQGEDFLVEKNIFIP